MKKLDKISLWLTVLALSAVSSQAQVIGNWDNESTGDGWINWSGGQDSVTVDPEFSFVTGAVPGYAQSLQLTHQGWQQNLAIKLEGNSPDQADFFNNTLFSLTWSIPAGTGGGYNQLWGLYINAGGGYGFTLQPSSEVSVTGSGETSGTGSELDYWSGSPAQTQTVTWNYASILPTLIADGDGPTSGYVELVLTSNNGSGQPDVFDFENATLSSPIPEPSTIALGVMGACSFLLRRRSK
ncbi:MAG: PEP-CTERM sorting domain-containing protein [Limisphaerales bacterium]